MTLVAGVDSSTQSVKVVIRDADSGELVRSGRARHPAGTEVHPEHWYAALQQAIAEAGGLADVAALAVAGQQHGMVALDSEGQAVRDALLWNDVRSAPQARRLVADLGHGDVGAGAAQWAARTGSVPVASYTVTKLAWMAEHEPENAARTAAVALPHDWLTWRLRHPDGSLPALETLATDRSDASGTGYFSAVSGEYDRELLMDALGHDAVLPTVAEQPHAAVGDVGGMLLGPGAGDNAGAALGLLAGPGDVVVSVGTSGVVSAVTDTPSADASGLVSGFADATGRFLPLACTLNASRVLDSVAALLNVSHQQLDELALQVPAGADGLVLVPWFEGERTPDLPTARASWHGMSLNTMTPAHLARAAYEALACSLAVASAAIEAQGVETQRVVLVGGGAASETLRQVMASVWDRAVLVPAPGEYVADGAARQAAWTLHGSDAPPAWLTGDAPRTYEPPTWEGLPGPAVLARYVEVSAGAAAAVR